MGNLTCANFALTEKSESNANGTMVRMHLRKESNLVACSVLFLCGKCGHKLAGKPMIGLSADSVCPTREALKG